MAEFGADARPVDSSGRTPEYYIESQAGADHGDNSKGINKVWQDLAIDIQEFQRKCFEDEQRHRRDIRSDPKCFEGMKKRHSIGF